MSRKLFCSDKTCTGRAFVQIPRGCRVGPLALLLASSERCRRTNTRLFLYPWLDKLEQGRGMSSHHHTMHHFPAQITRPASPYHTSPHYTSLHQKSLSLLSSPLLSSPLLSSPLLQCFRATGQFSMCELDAKGAEFADKPLGVSCTGFVRAPRASTSASLSQKQT